MNTTKTTKIESDYMGNDQFEVTIDGVKAGTICHIKRENIAAFSSNMTVSRSWTVVGIRGKHFATKADAERFIIRQFSA